MTSPLDRPMTRRTLGATAVTSALVAVAMAGNSAVAQGTPESSPEATPDASPMPAVAPAPSTAEVLPEYQALSDALRDQSRSLIDPLIAGDPTPLLGVVSPELSAALAGLDLTSFIAGLHSNQVRFAFAAVGAQWIGNVAADAITGFFQQGGIRDGFTLTRDGAASASPAASPAASASPIVERAASPVASAWPTGTWSGSLDTIGLAFSVTFGGDESAPTATLSIPDQGIADQVLDDVGFLAESPIGAMTFERSIPLNPGSLIYTQVREWGASSLQVDLTMAESQAIGLALQPAVTLPEDPILPQTSPVTYALPWQEGAWFIFWGGPTQMQNYHAPVPAQRHALDIVIWKDGATFQGDGTRADQYWVWGQTLSAPADGTVVSVLNDQPDQEPGLPLSVSNPEAFATLHPAGNHIMLQTADEEFVLLGHMQHGSILVHQGDTLTAGDPVGLVGNSGNTSEPHLHIHAQNRADFADPQALGIAMVFSGLTVDGAPAERVGLEQGTFAEPLPG